MKKEQSTRKGNQGKNQERKQRGKKWHEEGNEEERRNRGERKHEKTGKAKGKMKRRATDRVELQRERG